MMTGEIFQHPLHEGPEMMAWGSRGGQKVLLVGVVFVGIVSERKTFAPSHLLHDEEGMLDRAPLGRRKD